jgi:hypothetical protein
VKTEPLQNLHEVLSVQVHAIQVDERGNEGFETGHSRVGVLPDRRDINVLREWLRRLGRLQPTEVCRG